MIQEREREAAVDCLFTGSKKMNILLPPINFRTVTFGDIQHD